MKHESEVIVRTLYSVTFGDAKRQAFIEPYIISFCAHVSDYEQQNGLLSQWRGYGRSSGYALELDTAKFWTLMQADAQIYAYAATQLDAVQYDGSEECFASHFDDLVDRIASAYHSIAITESPNLDGLFGPSIHKITRYKHRGFSEENEVRAVLSPITSQWRERIKKEHPEEFKKQANRDIKPTLFKSGMKPYLALSSNRALLPITKIIVGPNREKFVRLEVLERFLRARGMAIPVVVSETPLV